MYGLAQDMEDCLVAIIRKSNSNDTINPLAAILRISKKMGGFPQKDTKHKLLRKNLVKY